MRAFCFFSLAWRGLRRGFSIAAEGQGGRFSTFISSTLFSIATERRQPLRQQCQRCDPSSNQIAAPWAVSPTVKRQRQGENAQAALHACIFDRRFPLPSLLRSRRPWQCSPALLRPSLPPSRFGPPSRRRPPRLRATYGCFSPCPGRYRPLMKISTPWPGSCLSPFPLPPPPPTPHQPQRPATYRRVDRRRIRSRVHKSAQPGRFTQKASFVSSPLLSLSSSSPSSSRSSFIASGRMASASPSSRRPVPPSPAPSPLGARYDYGGSSTSRTLPAASSGSDKYARQGWKSVLERLGGRLRAAGHPAVPVKNTVRPQAARERAKEEERERRKEMEHRWAERRA